jgi:drug/metabolite transporter (DMT)-like permease
VTAIIGGLGAAILWAMATLASSRSSRMLGSRVVLAWVMIVGIIVGLPIGLVTGVPADLAPADAGLLLVAGLCYSAGLFTAYTALTIGKVGIVAPIVATEGAIAALIAVALGDPLAAGAAFLLGIIVVGVVLSSIEPARPDVMAGDFEIAVDALDGPVVIDANAVADTANPADGRAMDPADARASSESVTPVVAPTSRPTDHDDTRKAAALAIGAAVIFGVGIVATGKAAIIVPPIWVAIAIRVIGFVVVVVPLLAQRRLTLTRAALPLVVISGTGEIIGSTLSAWAASVDIAIAAVLGSQFAAIAAVMAFLLFGERLSRTQVIGVILIVGGVSALAATNL